MSYERQVAKYRQKLANMKYSCSALNTISLKDRCVKDSKGKYNTQTECVFSDECDQIQQKFKILPEDILYEDFDIRILKPDVKKGIIIWTNYVQPPHTENICKSGLKTGFQLKKEGVEFGRSVYHPYIFFRAPYYNNSINYSSIESEIKSSYGDIDLKNRIFIRVDPDYTYTYSSEIRTISEWYGNYENYIKNSRKTLTEYLKIIKENSIIESNKPRDKQIVYNLFSSTAQLYSIKSDFTHGTVLNTAPINRNSEILVRIPHLTPNYFVLCS